MLELYISQNKNTTSEAYGKYYPRVSYKHIHEMAVHMATTRICRTGKMKNIFTIFVYV
jgi:hypothetical protein